MDLGIFALSLPVTDIEASLAFYQALGFRVIDGGHNYKGEHADTPSAKWRILEHESVKIGLFQGTFDRPILAWHPDDVRAIERTLKAAGIALTSEAQGDTGPAYITLTDPDGNDILFDQLA